MRRVIVAVVVALTSVGLVACKRGTTQQTQTKASPTAASLANLKFSGTSAPPELGDHSRQDNDEQAKKIKDRPRDQVSGLKILAVNAYGVSATSNASPVYLVQALFETSKDAVKPESLEGVAKIFGAKGITGVADTKGEKGVVYKCGSLTSGSDSPFCSYVLGNLLVIVAAEPGFDETEVMSLTKEVAADHLESAGDEDF
jgi:hypothetical protein